MHFRKLELADRDIYESRIGQHEFHTYEYTFLTLYFWREMCKTELADMDEAIIVRKADPRGRLYFMQPLGYAHENLRDIVRRLKEYKESQSGYGSLFGDIEAPFLRELQAVFGDRVVYREDPDNFDYIYDAQQLITLRGRKYHGKRNQYNRFTGGYGYEVRELREPGVCADAIRFAGEWYETRGEGDASLALELKGIKDVLTHIDALPIVGFAVYVGQRMAGFTFGETVGSRMAIVHVEKGDLAYDGIYAFLNRTMAERYFSGVRYINRQEDLGIQGLRKAKMDYNPVRFERKYIIDIV